jgi:hypothetical protein
MSDACCVNEIIEWDTNATLLSLVLRVSCQTIQLPRIPALDRSFTPKAVEFFAEPTHSTPLSPHHLRPARFSTETRKMSQSRHIFDFRGRHVAGYKALLPDNVPSTVSEDGLPPILPECTAELAKAKSDREIRREVYNKTLMYLKGQSVETLEPLIQYATNMARAQNGGDYDANLNRLKEEITKLKDENAKLKGDVAETGRDTKAQELATGLLKEVVTGTNERLAARMSVDMQLLLAEEAEKLKRNRIRSETEIALEEYIAERETLREELQMAETLIANLKWCRAEALRFLFVALRIFPDNAKADAFMGDADSNITESTIEELGICSSVFALNDVLLEEVCDEHETTCEDLGELTKVVKLFMIRQTNSNEYIKKWKHRTAEMQRNEDELVDMLVRLERLCRTQSQHGRFGSES